ncbi:MAG: hypothetical protein ACLR6I_07985 [Waltera sp.]
MNGVQNLKITQLAKTAYMTGGKLYLENQDRCRLRTIPSLNALTKLSDLSGSRAVTARGRHLTTGYDTLNIKSGDTSVELNITADTTISDVLTKLKEAGLNANFDETTAEILYQCKDSGECQ